MRAIEPVSAGDVERDGVRLHWEEFGEGEPTIALLPTWSIVHSRHWKFQVPYLARHYRVITFDGRGCGLSDRPDGPGRVQLPGVRRRHARRARCHRDRSRRARRALVGCGVEPQCSPPIEPDRVRRRRAVWDRRCALAPMPAERKRPPVRRAARRRRTGGRSTTATTGWRAATPTSSSSSSPSCSPSRTRRSRSRTSSAGGSRSTRRRWSPSTTASFANRRERIRAVCERDHGSGARDPRRRGRDHAPRRGRGARRRSPEASS